MNVSSLLLNVFGASSLLMWYRKEEAKVCNTLLGSSDKSLRDKFPFSLKAYESFLGA